MTTARRTLIKGAAALRVMLSVATQGQKVPRRGVGWRAWPLRAICAKTRPIWGMPLERQMVGGCSGYLVPRAFLHRRCRAHGLQVCANRDRRQLPPPRAVAS